MIKHINSVWKASERDQLELFLSDVKNHNANVYSEGRCSKCDYYKVLCCKKLCIIQGNSGSGKKTTLQNVAKHLSINLMEYDQVINYKDAMVDKAHMFLKFLSDSRRKRRLIINKKTTCATVIYDIPSTIDIKFVENLKRELTYITNSNNQIINPFVILSNYSSRDTVFLNRVIEDFGNNSAIVHLKISTISKTTIKKILYEWAYQKYNSNSEVECLSHLINHISEIAKGDLRFAISMMEFYSISYSNDYLPIGKDGNINPFHTLGKFLYNKRYSEVKWSSIECIHDTERYIRFLKDGWTKPPMKGKPPPANSQCSEEYEQYWDIMEIDIPIDMQTLPHDNPSSPGEVRPEEQSQPLNIASPIDMDLDEESLSHLPLGVRLDGLGISNKFEYLEPYLLQEGVGEPSQSEYKPFDLKCNRPCSYFIPEKIIEQSGCDDEYLTESLRQEFIYFFSKIEDVASAEYHFACIDTLRRHAIRFDYSSTGNMNMSAIVGRAILDCNMNPAKPKSNGGWLYKFKSLDIVTNDKMASKIKEALKREGENISSITFEYLIPFNYMIKKRIIHQLKTVYDRWIIRY